MKQSFLILFIVTLFLSCQSPTEMEWNTGLIHDYKELNEYVLESDKIHFYIKRAETLSDPFAQEIFSKLKSSGKLLNIDYSDKNIIFYQVKHEAVEPLWGVGLQYYSHYVVYSKKVDPNFETIFKKDYELEEKYYNSEKINKNWYYVIGEHFSD